MNASQKAALCRIVGVVLVTDGHLSDAEFDYFYALLDRLGVDGAARQEVVGAITIDADLSEDLKSLAEHRETLLEELAVAASLEGEPSAAVADLLQRLRAA